MKKKIGLLIGLLSSTIVIADNLDVHGRPMQFSKLPYSLMNPLGHIGIEFSGGIYNMLPTISPQKTLFNNQDNYLSFSSTSFFKNDKKYWGARYDKIPNSTQAKYLMDLGLAVGNDYSMYSIQAKNPTLIYNTRTKQYNYNRGVHRCDTFVISALAAGGKDYGSFAIAQPLYVFYKLPYKR